MEHASTTVAYLTVCAFYHILVHASCFFSVTDMDSDCITTTGLYLSIVIPVGLWLCLFRVGWCL